MKEKLQKRPLVAGSLILLLIVVTLFIPNNSGNDQVSPIIELSSSDESEDKSLEQRLLDTEERYKHEFDLQKNPRTGEIPLEEKEEELNKAMQARLEAKQFKSSQNSYISRGPTNLGGRTRAIKVDLSDNTSNTILAGGVSSGLFRTTNGGASWTKVSANDEIHNVTSLAQDPRPGFQNIWYYGTGEWTGNSASLGSAYRGTGIWRSTDSGVSWTQIAASNTSIDVFNSPFNYINTLQVHPTTGELFVAATGKIFRYDGANFNIELEESSGFVDVGWTDVTIASNGTVYASLDNTRPTSRGVWTSATGNGSWTRIAQNTNPAAWSSGGSARTVLATAPSNPDILYALYNNGISGQPPRIEAGLWKYDASTTNWTNYSSKLPDEAGGNLGGNDPFAIQGGYDLVVAVNPSDENFVLIGGTNAYKIDDITDSNDDFLRIGGYNSNASYALYQRSGDVHHPDIHAFEFDPFDVGNDILFTGTDGGVHKTTDVYASEVLWENLNNNYQTYQFYHVAMDPTSGSDRVLGGAQDNGSVITGLDWGATDVDQTNAFTLPFGGDGAAVAFGPQPADEFIFFFASQFGNLYRFDSTSGYDSGGLFGLQPNVSSSQFVTYFYLDTDNPNALYYAGNNILYLTTDAVNVSRFSWTNVGALPISQNLRTFATTPGAYNPSTSNLFIGGQNGG
ncbi:MAG: hypothetical protein AAGH46_03140, partial [Bacteroidota bacterium]